MLIVLYVVVDDVYLFMMELREDVCAPHKITVYFFLITTSNTVDQHTENTLGLIQVKSKT